MLKFSFDEDNNEKFFAGIRHIGVGLVLTGVIGLFFEQELSSASCLSVPCLEVKHDRRL